MSKEKVASGQKLESGNCYWCGRVRVLKYKCPECGLKYCDNCGLTNGVCRSCEPPELERIIE